MPDQPAVTDQAIDAYVTAINETYPHPDGPRELIRAGLAAAAPHLAEPVFAADLLAGITELELDASHPESRLVITANDDTLRELARFLDPAGRPGSSPSTRREPVDLAALARRHVEATEQFLRVTMFDGEPATIGRLATTMGDAAQAVRDRLNGQTARTEPAVLDVDRIAQAIGDPGSIVGPRRLPWREGGLDDGQGETVTRWATRAVLAVLTGTRCCNGTQACTTCGSGV